MLELLADAYAAGCKAAARDIRLDGQITADPLAGDSASGYTRTSLLQNFSDRIAAEGADAEAVLDSWLFGYLYGATS